MSGSLTGRVLYRTGSTCTSSLPQDVSKQLWNTLYDFPELKNYTNLKLYIEKCVRLAWMLSVQIPPMIIEHEAEEFSDKMHTRFFSSDMETPVIKYHVWPALIDARDGHVYYKLEVAEAD